MRLRKALLVGLAMALVNLGAPPASATIYSGACVVNVAFSFDTPVSVVPRTITYSVGAGSVRTLSQVAPACVVDTNALSPFRATSGGGEGIAQAWTCEETAGLGTWSQGWNPDPPPMSGMHTIAGTWGHWTMVVNSPSLNFTGEMELTVDPSDAAKLSQCATNGISSLKMIGVMHFQDPSL